MTLTQARLKELLHYNPETGLFTWLARGGSRRRAGDVAGSVKKDGYRYIGLCGERFLAHRLAWFYQHGEWPTDEVDHKNRARDDNRISNIRAATRAQNAINLGPRRNSTADSAGAYYRPKLGKWVSQISDRGKTRYLGLFTTEASAKAAYALAASARQESLH